MSKASNTETIQALGKIAAARRDVQGHSELLQAIPLWRPGAALNKVCQEVLDLIDDHERRLDRKLVVAAIGPGGSGKSTLVNALAGRDNLTSAGTQRPTTTDVVLVCRSHTDADFLKSEFKPDSLQVVTDSHALRSGHFLLMDTPDIDSTHQKSHRPLVRKVIEMADVLVCIFNAENPKTRDHVDFFQDYVQRFDGESLIGVLNKCDRIDENELTGYILPDFEQYIAKAWTRPLNSFFCISARRHLQRPDWDENAIPRHDFDQYQALEDLLTGVYSHSSAIADRRLKNVQQMTSFVQTEIQGSIQERKNDLQMASSLMKSVQKNALESAFDVMKSKGTGQAMGVNVHLYQKIAQQWFGPVGWLIALWARILIFGTGLMALFRFGNPVRQIMGIISSLRHFKDAEASVAAAEKGHQLDAAVRKYRMTVLRAWPEIADLLVRGGFDPSVRLPDTGMSDRFTLNDTLVSMWQETLGSTIETASRRFSGMWLQLLLNLPTIGILAHIAWLTARHYFAEDYLTTDFFIHAFLTAGIVMFLSFFLFQAALRIFYGPERILTKAFEQINLQLDPVQQVSIGPVFEQLEKLLNSK
jgi:GTPase SAR1 family protein